MTNDRLHRMADQLDAYIKGKQVSQNQAAKKIGIAPSYVTHIINRNFDAIPAGKDAQGNPRFTTLSEQIVKKVCTFLGIDTAVWDIDNYKVIMTTLAESKINQQHRIVDGLRGSGKTFAAKAFAREYSDSTYLVTCAEDMNPKSFMVELARLVGVSTYGDRRSIRLSIAAKLKTLKLPILIVDEAENLKPSAYSAIKALYDEVYEYCAIVLIGANDYVDFLRKRAQANRQCFPQLYSRFSASPVKLDLMSFDDVVYISGLYGVSDRATHKHLYDTCNDYRELDRELKRMVADQKLNEAA